MNTFCRSVEFSPKEKNCIVSDEDTYSRADQQGIVESKDYYEPICVAGIVVLFLFYKFINHINNTQIKFFYF